MKITCLFILNYTNIYAWNRFDGGNIEIDVNTNFSLIYGGSGTSVKGDFVATGNTIMDGDKSTNYFAGSTPHMLHQDSEIDALGTSSKNRNSSSATLSLPSYVTKDHIVWAGLFWQGQIHDSANNTNQVNSDVRGWNTVHMKTPDGTVHEISVPPSGNNNPTHTAYHYAYQRGGKYRFFYSAYADVTQIIKNGGYDNSHKTFTVGNINSTDRADSGTWMYFSHINEANGGQWYGSNLRMGHFGGWSLVVVYDVDQQTMNDHSDVKYKNISIYNGFDQFLTWGGRRDVPFETSIHLEGFRTPSNGVISSKLLFFGGGGDYGMASDTLAIEDGGNRGSYEDLTNNWNRGTQKFNGTFTNMNTLINPSKSYYQGIDLDIFDTSNMMAHAQTDTNIKFGVVYNASKRYCDQVFPQVLAFSTELYMPKLCYDYTVRMGDYIRIPSKNREINASIISDELPLNLKILLRSQEADFDLLDARMQIDFTPLSGSLGILRKPNTAEVSPPNINAYIPVDSNASGFFPIGRGITPHSAEPGGKIYPLESNYAKTSYTYTHTNDRIDAKFDIVLQTEINFAGNTRVPYRLSTQGTIEKCPTNAAYDPIWNIFNAERTDSYKYDPVNEAYLRYPLYTQIAGKDYAVDIVRYQEGDLSNPFQDKNNTVVEVELIDAGSFDNNSSVGFDSICEEPAALGSTNHGTFINFYNTDRIEINIPDDIDGYDNEIALENAAFRMWILTHEVNATTGEREIIHHNCTSLNGSCFQNLYANTVSAYDTTSLCSNDCSSGNELECYMCMRKYFATPVCSRDNFSVRPDGFRIAISDNNESTSSLPVPVMLIQNNSEAKDYASSVKPFELAAGYRYPFEVNATLYQTGLKSTGYYNIDFFARQNITLIPNVSNKSGVLSAMEFTQQSDPCIDKTHRSLGFRMINSEIDDSVTLPDVLPPSGQYPQINVGTYKLWIVDANWTEVDQAYSARKPVFNNRPTNDCIDSDANHIVNDEGKIGCLTSSTIKEDNSNYLDLYLDFNPYRFDLSGITLKNNPDIDQSWLYFNNLANDNNDIGMAANVKGIISAVDRDNNITTNFTAGCAAKDVELWIEGNVTADSVTPDSNISAGVSTEANGMSLQQTLVDIGNSDGSDVETDNNLTLEADNFTSVEEGNATVDLYINFDKNYTTPSNPVQVFFSDVNASSPGAWSHAQMKQHYIPDGNQQLDSNRIFLYAKVAPKLGDEYIITYDNNYTTFLRVDVYCNDTAMITCYDLQHVDDTNTSRNILGVQEELHNTGPAAWYRMENHIAALDGNVTRLKADHNGIIELPINTDITFDSNGSTSDLTFTYPYGQPRPGNFVITITPDAWLKYNPDPAKKGLPEFSIHYLLQGLKWKGEGRTGHVIGTDPYSGENKRLNW